MLAHPTLDQLNALGLYGPAQTPAAIMTIALISAERLRTNGGATRPWTTAGFATAQWRARLSPPLPTATRHVVLNHSPFLGRLKNRTALTDPVQANIIAFDPRKQTSGGRHQIGTLAGFRSESVVGFI